MDRISGRPSLAAAAVASAAVACRNHETKPTCAAGCSCEKNMLSLAAARLLSTETCTFGRKAEEGTAREFPGIPGDSESCLRTDKRAKGYTRGGWRAAHGRCAGRQAGVLVRGTSSTYSSAGRRRGRCSIFAMPTAPASRHLGRDRPKYWRIPCEIAASVSSTRAR